MQKTFFIPDYDPAQGIKVQWEDDFIIDVKDNVGIITISANKAGLISLAAQLLTLAQDGVPSGSHIHYDQFNALEEGSSELIVERL